MRWRPLGPLSLLVLVVSCSLSPGDFDSYRRRGEETAEEVIGAARMAQLMLDVAGDRAFRTYVEIGLQEAQADASAAVRSFAALRPPDSSARVFRRELLELIEPLTREVAEARSAVASSEFGPVDARLDRLRQAAGELERFIRR
jgi:hypothetical protein